VSYGSSCDAQAPKNTALKYRNVDTPTGTQEGTVSRLIKSGKSASVISSAIVETAKVESLVGGAALGRY